MINPIVLKWRDRDLLCAYCPTVGTWSCMKLWVEIAGYSFGTEICLKAEPSFGSWKKLTVLCWARVSLPLPSWNCGIFVVALLVAETRVIVTVIVSDVMVEVNVAEKAWGAVKSIKLEWWSLYAWSPVDVVVVGMQICKIFMQNRHLRQEAAWNVQSRHLGAARNSMF